MPLPSMEQTEQTPRSLPENRDRADTAPVEEDTSPVRADELVQPGGRTVAELPAIYGSFWLDNTEFALRARVIKEVVNEPVEISAVPLSPPFMLGLFNLRGTIIPIVDLRLLLKFTATQVTDRKVAIIEDGDVFIGLMVDRTGEVLNIKGAGRVDLRRGEGEIEEIVVEGLLKLEDGRRIVQILDPCEILSLKNVPRGETSTRDQTTPATTSWGSRLSCLSFQMGHTNCAIDLRYVKEVMETPEIIDSVLVNDCFVGITNLRGRIIPVADFRNLMGDEADIRASRNSTRKRKILIVETEGGLIGLLVYSIDSIMTYFRNDILQFTKLALPRADIVKGCLIGKENEIVLVFDHEVLRTDPVLVETARRCEEVHPFEEGGKPKDEDDGASARLTFIVFSFGKHFALDTSLISEVINYHETMLNPPYALDFVEGIMSLRGDLIPLINPRTLYGLPTERKAGKRVLIFKHEDRKYGIIVDYVDEIVITTANKVTERMAINHKTASLTIAEDVSGCIHSPTRGLVMILDVNAVLQRCFAKAGGTALEQPISP